LLFEKSKEAFSYELVREGDDRIVKINCDRYSRAPSIEDDSITMAKAVEILTENKDATKVVFHQKRDYEYDYDQTVLLKEIGQLNNQLVKEKHRFSYNALQYQGAYAKNAEQRFNEIQTIIYHLLKSDPVGAYVELRRILRHQRLILMKIADTRAIPYQENFVQIVTELIKRLEATKLIILAKPMISGMRIGNRDIYRNIFKPTIKPDFMNTKLMSTYPEDGEEIESYKVGETEVTVFKLPSDVRTLYHINPPEFRLDEEQYEILDLARRILAEHKPTKEEFVNPERMRRVFFNVGRDLCEELANYRNVRMSEEDLNLITRILIRYTIGFGLIEVLMEDDDIQDISVNSPYGTTPIFIVHGKHDDCITNIIPTRTEAESWATKLRMISGRPLDEANPILDTELELPGASIRTSVITEPLDPTGLAFSFRRHRAKPWTLPLFIKNKMISPLGAGLLSFLIDGTRTFFVCGTRSSGKSSFLGGMLIEIMRRYRIITIEDTMELPFTQMKDLGFNIVAMKVASALSEGSGEFTATQGIRSTLRLGDSSLIVGEVRSKEAVALFEGMRVSAGANVAGGTFHSDSPYGVFDRVVNAIGIPATSFKALDLVIIANPIKSADGLHKFRRVTQITEVRKDWIKDPMMEGGFQDLMKYDAKTDMLQPSGALIDGDSEVIKSIAANIPDFVGNWDAVWENIELRGKFKQAIVEYADKSEDKDALEAPFVIKCNDAFHLATEKVKNKVGKLDSKEIYKEWESWFTLEIKRRQMEIRQKLEK